MSGRAKYLLLAGLLWAGVAWGQTYDGQPYPAGKPVPTDKIPQMLDDSDSTGLAIRGTLTDGLKSYDSSRDRDQVGGAYFKTIMSASVMTDFDSDSSIVFPSYNWGRMGVMIVPQWMDTISTTVRLAMQLRAHVSETAVDTLSVFGWHSFGNAALAAGADSIVQITGGAGTMPWDGETEITLLKSHVWLGGVPRGMYVPLQRFGNWWWAPYTSIRFRMLSGDAASSASRIKLTVYAVGTPL